MNFNIFFSFSKVIHCCCCCCCRCRFSTFVLHYGFTCAYSIGVCVCAVFFFFSSKWKRPHKYVNLFNHIVCTSKFCPSLVVHYLDFILSWYDTGSFFLLLQIFSLKKFLDRISVSGVFSTVSFTFTIPIKILCRDRYFGSFNL